MRRVLIINRCGLLSALPTLAEYHDMQFITDDMIKGIVEVSDDVVKMVFGQLGRVKVLAPMLPKDIEPDCLYVAIVGGRLILVEHQRPNIKVQKKAGFIKNLSGYFGRIFNKK